jgi:large subunit ribosomal protein L9
MKVILNNDISSLGEEGDILEVKPGYARNYLIPRGLVSMFNKANLATLEGRRKQIEKRREAKRLAAAGNKAKIEAALIVFEMPAGENGKLFGAVTAQMIHDELEKLGVEVERKKIEIPSHTLKGLGDYKLTIRLYNDEEAELKVKVISDSSKPENAEAKKPAPAPEAIDDTPEETDEVAEEVSAQEEEEPSEDAE